jgi:hypothetical protein
MIKEDYEIMKKQWGAMDIERERQLWASVAKKNSWYEEPFYVQVWTKNDEIIDSVSFVGLDRDIIEEAI